MNVVYHLKSSDRLKQEIKCSIIIDFIRILYTVTFYEVDVDEAEAELLDKYGIQSVPAMIFFNEGLQVGREIGNIPKSTLLEKINLYK